MNEVENQIQIMTERLTEQLNEIRWFLEQLRQDLAETLQKSEFQELQADLERIKSVFDQESLGAVVRELEQLQQTFKGKELQAFLHPKLLEWVRVMLEEPRMYLANLHERLGLIHEDIQRLQDNIARWAAEKPSIQKSLAQSLKPMDDTITIIQRALSSLQEVRPNYSEALYLSVQTVASLLHGSLRLATLLFSEQQLRRMAAEPRARNLAILHKRWGEWLRELADYVRTVGIQAQEVALFGEGTQAESFRAALEAFQTACQEVAQSGPRFSG